MNNPSINLLNISHANKSYNGIAALIDASLDLRSGEVHALMGENGAGKSTLIKLLAGVVRPDSIQISIRGQAVSIPNPQAAFDLGLRFIYQELNSVPQLSVAENLFLGYRYPSRAGIFINWRRLYQDTQEILERLGITHISPRTLMTRLSPGDQMLVKIAASLVGDVQATGSIYVMDEPTAALTGHEIEKLFAVIDRLRQRGCSILYVSHRMDEIFQIADRVTVMRDGRVIATQNITETTRAELIHLMTGRDLQQVFPNRTTSVGESVLLEVQNLGTADLNNISFQVHAGEIIGIAGLIGSGRTELLRALMSIDGIQQGNLTLAGKRLRAHSPASTWKQGLAFVPEERRTQGLVLSRSVGNNISLPYLNSLSIGGILLNSRRERDTAQRITGQVNLRATSERQKTRELSGGNQQKTVFARALTGSPRLLLLDEPTRGVDVGAKYDIYTLIRSISAQGVGIILVSSELPELIGLCDRLLILQKGRLTDIVSTEGLTERQLLSLCYGASDGDTPHEH